MATSSMISAMEPSYKNHHLIQAIQEQPVIYFESGRRKNMIILFVC